MGFTRPLFMPALCFLRQRVNVALGLACCLFPSLYYFASAAVVLDVELCVKMLCFDLSIGDFLKRFLHSYRRENNVFSHFTLSALTELWATRFHSDAVLAPSNTLATFHQTPHWLSWLHLLKMLLFRMFQNLTLKVKNIHIDISLWLNWS